MTTGDLAALHALAYCGAGTGRPWAAAEFEAFLREPHVFLCKSQDTGAGFALGRAIAGEAELLTLVVRPERRRAGLGRGLLRAFEREAQRRGAEEAFLEVAARNLPAVALYVAAGYAERGRRPGYYALDDGKRADALILSRALHV